MFLGEKLKSLKNSAVHVMHMAKNLKNIKLLSFFALGIALMLGVISLFGLSQVLSTLLTTNPLIFILAVGVHIGILLLLALRIMIIVRKNAPISLKKALNVTISGLVVNFLTPIMKVGGEPVKIYMLKDHIGTSQATAAIAMDTFIEILSSIIVFVAIFLLFFSHLPPHFLLLYIAFTIISISILLVYLKVSMTPSWIRKLVNFGEKKLSKFIKLEKKDYANIFYNSFKRIIQDRKTMSFSLGVSTATKFLEFLRMWLVFLAIGVIVPAETIVIVWAFLLILFMIPWLPGGLGLIEGGITYAFVTFGISGAVAASGVLLDRFISFWFILVIGGILVSKFAMDIRKVTRSLHEKIKVNVE